jgi:hypothetical protein
MVEPKYYKFGITDDLPKRLYDHKRSLQYQQVIKLFECSTRRIAQDTETKFANFAYTAGFLVRKYEQTEIICVDDITPIIEWFEKEINEYPVPENKETKVVVPIMDADMAVPEGSKTIVVTGVRTLADGTKKTYTTKKTYKVKGYTRINGEKKPKTVLTEDQIRKIKEMRELGVTKKRICEEFGCTYACLEKALK